MNGCFYSIKIYYHLVCYPLNWLQPFISLDSHRFTRSNVAAADLSYLADKLKVIETSHICFCCWTALTNQCFKTRNAASTMNVKWIFATNPINHSDYIANLHNVLEEVRPWKPAAMQYLSFPTFHTKALVVWGKKLFFIFGFECLFFSIVYVPYILVFHVGIPVYSKERCCFNCWCVDILGS